VHSSCKHTVEVTEPLDDHHLAFLDNHDTGTREIALLMQGCCSSPADNDGEEERPAHNSNDNDLHQSRVHHCWGRRGEGMFVLLPAFI
jgi:hypothetical protein